MPRYKVPKREPFSPDASEDAPRLRTLYVPVDPKWFNGMKVGRKVELTVKGEIVGLHLDEGKKRKESEVEVGLETVEYYPESEASKGLDDPPEED